jgi:hypothetical protein
MGVSEFLRNALKRPNYLLPVAAVVFVLDVVAMVTTSPPSRVATGLGDSAVESPTVSPGESIAPEVAASQAAAAQAATRRSTSAKSAVGSTVAISDTEVAVGMTYLFDAGKANSAAGFGSIGQVDQKRALDMMIAEVNKVKPGGRKVVPVMYRASEDDVISKGDQFEQEVCQFYTKDNKVFMTWDTIVGTDVLHKCLTDKKVAELGVGAGSKKDYERFPYVTGMNSVAMDRMAAFYVDQLVSQGFFSSFKQNDAGYTPSPVQTTLNIGLIRYDQPQWDDAAAVLKQRLAAHNLSLCSGCEFKIAYSPSDPAAMLDDAGEVQAAINGCKNRTGGPCTHMLFLGTQAGGRIAIFYVDGAEKQAYRARLGLNANDLPDAVVSFYKGQGVPDAANPAYPQYRDGVLVSTDPARLWMDAPEFPRCKKLFQTYGETFEGSAAANKHGQIPDYCDIAWYHIAAMNIVGKSLSLQTWMNAVEHMPPVPSAATFLMQTKVGRHDGAGAIRVGKWDAGAGKFNPVTGDIPV